MGLLFLVSGEQFVRSTKRKRLEVQDIFTNVQGEKGEKQLQLDSDLCSGVSDSAESGVSVSHAGLPGEEHRPHASRHRGLAQEQQKRLHLQPDGHRPGGDLPLGGAAGLLQSPGGFQGGRPQTHPQENG